MGKKYFVWNFDDGLEQDKKIVEILRSFHMGATFNLNSGLYGKQQMIGRIGTLGCKEVPAEEFRKQKHHLLKYVPHCRIPKDEIIEVYEGFEIASHTVSHRNLTKLTETEIREEILQDVQQLSRKFSQNITGFAYPFGASNETAKKLLQDCGITYARTVGSVKSFDFAEDPMNLPYFLLAYFHQGHGKAGCVPECAGTGRRYAVFDVCHGYEFDFGVKESSWEKFKRICDRVASHDEIICCSTAEALAAHNK